MSSSSEQGYRVKRTDFLNRKNVPIIMQNENGPCPLIAISNVLLLRNSIQLQNESSEVGHDELLAIVANHLFDANNDTEGRDENYIENRQRNVDDVIRMLPKLATGIDVNVRFGSIHDFEFTPEIAIFDLVGIRLVHGWLVDPQDATAATAVGRNSYNKLLEQIVSFKEKYPALVASLMKANSHREMTEAEGPMGVSRQPFPAEITSEEEEKTAEEESREMGRKLSSQGASEPEVGQSEDTIGGNPENSEANSRVEEAGPSAMAAVKEESPDKDYTNDCSLEKALQMSLSLGEEPQAAHGEPAGLSQPENPKEEDRNEEVAQGLAVLTFLESTASQLTYHGLFSLQEGLRERELAVFFRNNHFNTIFKYNGALYLLATDQGYFGQPNLVWEKLGEVEGNSEFFSGKMEIFQPDSIPSSWMEEDDTVAAGLMVQSSQAKDFETNSDLQFAMALQQQEMEQQRTFREAQRTQRKVQTVHGMRPASAANSSLRRVSAGPARSSSDVQDRSKKATDCVVM